MKRLVALSCSQRKVPDPEPLPAIERYDGPAFRVLRRYLRTTHDDQLAIYILSAQYGLIPADRRIPWYDRRMTPDRAEELQPSVVAAIFSALRDLSPKSVFFCMSRLYRRALGPTRSLNETLIRFSDPGQGRQLASLKNWLFAAK